MKDRNNPQYVKILLVRVLICFLIFGFFIIPLSSTFSVNAKEKSEKASLIKEAISEMNIGKKDSVYTKVKKVHDWMVYNLKYDYLWYNVDKGETSGYTKAKIKEAKKHYPADVEWVLKNRLAICQGYSEVFQALLKEVGIECKVISSESMNHAWNLVKMDDGYWYHVDVTWDDSGYTGASELGGYNTENFLRNEKGISGNHDGWNKKESKANGKKYEKSVNHNIRYNITEKDEFYENGDIKLNYDYRDDTCYSEYNKKGIIVYKKFRYSGGSLGERHYTDKGVISYEKAYHDNGIREIWYNKKGLKKKEIYTFTSGGYWLYTYDKNGELKEKTYYSK